MAKTIVVLGAGESGVGAAILAKKKGLDVVVSDSEIITKENKKSTWELLILCLLITISILTGTRSVLIYISFAYIYKYGFSTRNIL